MDLLLTDINRNPGFIFPDAAADCPGIHSATKHPCLAEPSSVTPSGSCRVSVLIWSLFDQ